MDYVLFGLCTTICWALIMGFWGAITGHKWAERLASQVGEVATVAAAMLASGWAFWRLFVG